MKKETLAALALIFTVVILLFAKIIVGSAMDLHKKTVLNNQYEIAKTFSTISAELPDSLGIIEYKENKPWVLGHGNIEAVIYLIEIPLSDTESGAFVCNKSLYTSCESTEILYEEEMFCEHYTKAYKDKQIVHKIILYEEFY